MNESSYRINEVFEKDINHLVDVWSNKKWQGDDFNVNNIEAILRLYDNAQKYKDTTREKLEEWLGWKFYGIGQKRNNRPQADHLEEARAIRDIRMRRQGKKWTDGNGPKPKDKIVKQWRKEHPEGTKKQCKDDTGLTYNTIRKWWNYEDSDN